MTLRRELSALDLIIIGVGATVGSGIFVVVGQAAAVHAGPAVVVAFAISAFVCACCGLCYAELASAIPRSGGAYSYAHELFGRFPGWLIFWCLALEYGLAAAVVAVGFSGYLTGFLSSLGLSIPDTLSHAPFAFVDGRWTRTGALVNLPAALAVGVLSAILCRGIAVSARANRVLVTVKITMIVLFVAASIRYVRSANWSPFVPPNSGTRGEFGWSGVFAAAGVLFFSFLGFDAVASLAQETRHPQRDVPIGIIGTLAVACVLYVLVSMVLTGMISYRMLNVPNPVYVAIHSVGPPLQWLGAIVNVGAMIGMLSVMLAVLLAISRAVYVAAEDGLLPAGLARVQGTTGAPVVGTMLTGVLTAALAAAFPIDVLTQLISIGTLCAFASVCIGVIVIRHRYPGRPAPFRTPGFPVTPLLGLASSIYLIASMNTHAWLRFAVWIAFGVVLYGIRAQLIRGRLNP